MYLYPLVLAAPPPLSIQPRHARLIRCPSLHGPNPLTFVSSGIILVASPCSLRHLQGTDTIAVAGPSGASRPEAAISLTLWRIQGGAISHRGSSDRQYSSASPLEPTRDTAADGMRARAGHPTQVSGEAGTVIGEAETAGGVGRGSQRLKWSGDGGTENTGKRAQSLWWNGGGGRADGGESETPADGRAGSEARLSVLHCVALEGGSLVIPAPKEGLDRVPPGAIPALLPLVFPGLRAVLPPVQVSLYFASARALIRWHELRQGDI